ncbi:hypothetical protein Tco_0639159 [Tanacetum coccineum]
MFENCLLALWSEDEKNDEIDYKRLQGCRCLAIAGNSGDVGGGTVMMVQMVATLCALMSLNICEVTHVFETRMVYEVVWMSHGDEAVKMPNGFEVKAREVAQEVQDMNWGIFKHVLTEVLIDHLQPIQVSVHYMILRFKL